MAGTELVFELRCSSQKYHWGKLGSDSEVASLLHSGDPSFTVEPETRYAELWMGTHPSGPSTIVIPGKEDTALDKWLKQNPDKLGDSVNKKFNGALPYLFKVLSVSKALSIQAHPNKSHAEELHKRDPTNYKDSNHKPEMAIALTDFTGLCGFRPIAEVAKFVQEIEELREVVSKENAEMLVQASESDNVDAHETAMGKCFSRLMSSDKETVEMNLKKLVDKVKALEKSDKDIRSYVGDILLKLDSEFPGDVGGFSIYFLNVLRLKKGEAIFLEANLPHAYLAGDCMECMACSDNVVRAGLTPKYIDKETLITMLNYRGRPADDNKFKGKDSVENGCNLRRFSPPIEDFAVTEIKVPKGSSTLPTFTSASIVICIEGSGNLTNQSLPQSIDVKRGTVFFITAGEKVSLSSSDGMLLFASHAGC